MPSTVSDKDIRYGYSDGETGWGDEQNDNLEQISLSMRHQWSQRHATTVGLVYGYFGGVALSGGALVQVANGTISLSASSTNYIERTVAGVVSSNTTGFSADKIPMAVAVSDGSNITSVADWRSNGDILGGTGRARFDGGLSMAGTLVMRDVVSKLIPGATSFSLRNAADDADNLLLTDAGVATFRASVTATQFNGSGAGLTNVPATSLTGTVPSARISGSYSGITAVGTLTSLAVTGSVSLAMSSKVGYTPEDVFSFADGQAANYGMSIVPDASVGGAGAVSVMLSGYWGLSLATLATERLRITTGGHVAALTGFLYIPNASGAPVGTPPVIGTSVPICYDEVLDILWIYNRTAGSWRALEAFSHPEGGPL